MILRESNEMNQMERLNYLIASLTGERGLDGVEPVPSTFEQKKALFRALVNVRPALPVTDEFLAVQNRYLRSEIENAGITELQDIQHVYGDNVYLWLGDITRLKVDGIVNAANSQLLGCFVPGHHCIDNAIHTFAGVQLRLACNEMMQEQGHAEPTGQAKITPAFNLPSEYVLHTVGPIISGPLTEKDRELLASCYQACFDCAKENGLRSIAFCCISTGEFRFPPKEASDIALNVIEQNACDQLKVVINVFKESDKQIYERSLNQMFAEE